jgi:hypothetical protein
MLPGTVWLMMDSEFRVQKFNWCNSGSAEEACTEKKVKLKAWRLKAECWHGAINQNIKGGICTTRGMFRSPSVYNGLQK